MGKKFMGLGGTDHFWDRAKAWILNQITSAVTAKIAEVVANAPEDLDTLKEIADWITEHADDAAAMNTQIQTNKDNIAANSSNISAMNTQIQTNKDNIAANSSSISVMNTQIQTNKDNIAANSSSISAMNTAILANTEAISGKADKSHTHTKSQITDFPTSLKNPNALTVNGKTYDGSSAVDAGVQTVANGGTGATDAASGFNTLADGVRDSSTPRDDEKMLLKPTGTWYKTTCLDFWNYIKGKISSVLGLTKDNYGGTAAAILDYNRNTPIKVRWGGPGIDSAEWYPAFNADGSALEPISRTNIHAGTANKVASEGASTMWIEGRANAICKTTSAAGGGGWKTLASIKTSSGSIEIGNLSGEDYIRIVYSSDADVNSGNNNVTQLLYIRRGNIEIPHELIANSAKASSKMVIPIGAPSSLEDGCIWIER